MHPAKGVFRMVLLLSRQTDSPRAERLGLSRLREWNPLYKKENIEYRTRNREMILKDERLIPPWRETSNVQW